MLHILIADDYEVIRREIRQILLEEFLFVTIKEADDTDSLIENGIAKHWDIIITDLSMPGVGGVQAIIQILKIQPQQRLLVVSVNSPEQYAAQLLRHGVYGFLSKDMIHEKLIEAVKTILDGNRYYIP